jgi:hypothetical protein
MASVQDLLGSIRSSLDSGTVSLSLLGNGSSTLNLDDSGGLQRYAAVLDPHIQLALKRTKRERAIVVVLLIAFIILAAGIAVYDHLNGANSTVGLFLVPGLGVAAVWPLQSLIALNQQAFALEVFPGLMPLLTRQQAAKLAEQFLSRGLIWHIGAKAARSSR